MTYLFGYIPAYIRLMCISPIAVPIAACIDQQVR